VVAALEGYGRDLGIAFQIADDVLDIWGEEKTTGKSLGTDLEKQKLTLPIIRMLNTASAGNAAAIRRLLGEADGENRHRLRPYLEASGALDYAWERAEEHATLAAAALETVPPSLARTTLRDLAAYVVRRRS
jgi:octaprenyl-diphosphate synthase